MNRILNIEKGIFTIMLFELLKRSDVARVT